MPESDTMFNERDRRCAVVQLTRSTDRSYDNRSIASTLKIRTVQRAQGDENKVSGYGYSLWCVFKRGSHHATSHLRSRLESQHQSVPGCAEECGDPHKSKETQTWLQKECYDFIRFSHWPPSFPNLNLLNYFVWSYVENITNMTSHNTKASLIDAIRWVFAEFLPALVEKAYSQIRIRIEAVSEAEGGYIE